MPKIAYKDMRWSKQKKDLADKAITIVESYRKQGYDLTLRQVYYQFVARDWFPADWADASTGSTNNEKSYKKLGDIISDARMCGLMDWNSIKDRTRNVDGNNHWDDPAEIIQGCASSFRLDKWVGQKYRVEIWVEKDALEGIVGRVARQMEVDFLSCRGYTSMTAMWDSGQRLKSYAIQGQHPVILHLGDHDPSGIDMSRDIEERVSEFMDGRANMLTFERIALNMPQVEEFTPPPNPAKITDTRFRKYQDEHGDESWELDALEPSVIDGIIRSRIQHYLQPVKFEELKKAEDGHKADLLTASEHWDTRVADLIRELQDED